MVARTNGCPITIALFSCQRAKGRVFHVQESRRVLGSIDQSSVFLRSTVGRISACLSAYFENPSSARLLSAMTKLLKHSFCAALVSDKFLLEILARGLLCMVVPARKLPSNQNSRQSLELVPLALSLWASRAARLCLPVPISICNPKICCAVQSTSEISTAEF